MAATLVLIALAALLLAALVLPPLSARILREYEHGVIFRLGPDAVPLIRATATTG